ncbi:MAG: hypothetical protein FJ299_14745 [Planctomycetes bacterium]|nr:hypothetical protein [Planctomycetota bacterium]
MPGIQPVLFVRRLWQRSPWIVISVGVHVIAGGILALKVVGSGAQPVEQAPIAIVRPPRDPAPAFEPPPDEEIIERTNKASTDPVEIVDLEIPADLIDPTRERDYSKDLGFAEGGDSADLPPEISTSAGVGKGGYQSPHGPSPFGLPKPGSRRGGRPGDVPNTQTAVTERAVLEGLRWLARHQAPDGSWGTSAARELCVPGSGCVPEEHAAGTSYDTGLTGLALLAYLGAGYGHDSKSFFADTVLPRKHTTGEIVKRGLQWLVDQQRDDGSFGPGRTYMYNHALATMALCEAYGLSRHRYWREPAQRAVDYLVAAQRSNPSGSGGWGWRYAARQEIEQRRAAGELDDAEYAAELHDADTSVTTWCVMALKSAELAELKVPRASFDGALAFVRWVTPRESSASAGGNSTGRADNARYPGTVGYLDPSTAGQKVNGPSDHYRYHPAVMSALGMCARAFGEHDASDPFLEAAAKLIVKDLPEVSADKLSVDYYYWYYASLALNHFDGPHSPRKGQRYWKPWNEAMTRALLSLQDPTERSCSKGGWLVPDRWCHAGGPIYATATNVLTLEVYYRYENAFGAPRSTQPRKAAAAIEERIDEK